MFVPERGNQVLWPGRVGGPGQNERFGRRGNGGLGQVQSQAVWPGALGEGRMEALAAKGAAAGKASFRIKLFGLVV